MVNVGVIGYGYWGPNLVRNFADCSGAKVTAVCDQREDRRAVAARRYPGAVALANPDELIERTDVDAVVIATPVSSHFHLAERALKAGKHVLIEKPMTANSDQALRLLELAATAQRTLMVDHTFVYTGPVRKIRDLITAGELGHIYYYDSVRINLGLFQHDVNVLWDLAVHDLSILDYVIDSKPVAVSANGISHVPGKTENIAYLALAFANNFIAHMHVNWLAPVKIRRTLIGGTRKMIVYDDLEGSEKLKVYDKGISVNGEVDRLHQLRINYRSGDMWAPQVDNSEALKLEANEFVNAIETQRRPATDGEAGLRVVRILEAASQSLERRGEWIELGRGATA